MISVKEKFDEICSMVYSDGANERMKSNWDLINLYNNVIVPMMHKEIKIYNNFSAALNDSAVVAHAVYNTLCAYPRYKDLMNVDKSFNFSMMPDSDYDDVFLPLNDNNSADVPVCDWMYFLFSHFSLHSDHNLYFNCILSYHGYLLVNKDFIVDDTMLDFLRDFLTHFRVTPRMKESKVNFEEVRNVFNVKATFTQLVDCLKVMRNVGSTIFKLSRDYAQCYACCNDIYRVYSINRQDKSMSLLDTGNSVLINSNNRKAECCLKFNAVNCKKSLSPNIEHTLAWLNYFVNYDMALLDALALDFVYLVMDTNMCRRNTLVSGDIDKLYKWLMLCTYMADVLCVGTPKYRIIYGQMDKRMVNAFMTRSEYIKDDKTYIPFNMNDFSHTYFCNIQQYLYEDKGNKQLRLDFEYGGRYYELPFLEKDDFVWLAQLFLAHGWHLLNKATKKHTAQKIDSVKIFIDKFMTRTTEHRMPGGLLYAVYCAYVQTDVRLKGISKEAFISKVESIYNCECKGKKQRNSDHDYYHNQILPELQKHGIVAEERWGEKNTNHKSFECVINKEIWQELSQPQIKEDDVKKKQFEDYINDLYLRYKPIFCFDDEEPEFLKTYENVQWV